MAKNARIKITAEDKTKKAIDSAKNNFNDLKDAATRASTVIAGIAGAAGIGALIQKQSEFIRINSRMATQLGITTESLSRLSYAFTQNTEVSGEQFNEMLQEFNVRMGDAEKGTGPLIDAFKELGLNFDDIKKLKTDEALLKVSDAMKNLGDKSRVAFLAEELFAGEAAKATAVFLAGSDAIEQYGDEAERLGLVFTDEQAQKVRDAEKAYKGLANQVEGLGKDITIFLSGPGKGFLEFLTQVISDVRNMPQKLDELFDFAVSNTRIKEINRQIEKLIENLDKGYSINRRGRKEFLSEEDVSGIRARIKLLQDEAEALRAVRNATIQPAAPPITPPPIIDTAGSGEGKKKQSPGVNMLMIDDGMDSHVKERQEYMLEQARFGAEQFLQIWGSTFDTFSQGVGDAFANAIMEQESLGDALQLTMRQVAKSVISTLVQLGVQQITNLVKVKGMQSAANAALIGELGAITAAATPAAIAANIATAGAAGAAAAASGTAAATAMKSAMLLGQFHDGVDYVPKTGSYLLEKGERVIPKKDNKPGMMGGTFNINIQAIDTQSAAQVIMQNEPQIVQMIQRAYDSRGKVGGPVR